LERYDVDERGAHAEDDVKDHFRRRHEAPELFNKIQFATANLTGCYKCIIPVVFFQEDREKFVKYFAVPRQVLKKSTLQGSTKRRPMYKAYIHS
jgi:hypothetical protein